jgi:hypothetical protein
MVTRQLEESSTLEDVIRSVNSVVFRDRGAQTGTQDFGDTIVWRVSTPGFLLDLLNQDAGGQHANLGGVLTVRGSGVAITGTVPFVVGGATTLNSTLHVVGVATLDSTLSAGATTVSTLHATGNATVDGGSTLQGVSCTTLHATAAVTLDSTLSAAATTVTTLHATGAITVDGTSGLQTTNVTVLNSSGLATLASATVTTNLLHSSAGGTWGMFGHAGLAKQTITGVRSGTLAQLQAVVLAMLTALGSGGTGHGVWTDSTT